MPKAKEPKKTKPDLFRFFREADRGNFRVVDDYTDEEVRQISPFVLMMWEPDVNPGVRSILLNLYLNQYVFGQLRKHPRLLLKLFVEASSMGDGADFRFKKKATQAGSTGGQDLIRAVSRHYNVSVRAARDLIPAIPDDFRDRLVETYARSENSRYA